MLLSARIFNVQVRSSLAPAAPAPGGPGRDRQIQSCCFAHHRAPSR